MSDVNFYEVFKKKVYGQLKYFSSEEEFDEKYYGYLRDIIGILSKRSVIEGADLLVEAANRFEIKYAVPHPVDHLRRYNYAKGKSYADYVVSHKGAISKPHVDRLINHSFFYNKFLKIKLNSCLNFSNIFKLKKTDREKATFELQSHIDIHHVIHNLDKRIGKGSVTHSLPLDKEIPADKENYKHWEGTLNRMIQNRYERNPQARQVCLDHYGYSCQVCGFDFEKKYGSLGRLFIHVHHLTPLSHKGGAYKINPVEDMRPVCPNCHAMLHRKDPPLKIDQLKKLIS